MCNSHHTHYRLCGHTLTPPSQAEQHWAFCQYALSTGKRCDFAVFSEVLHVDEGRCPSCVEKWVREVDEKDERGRREWRGRLRRREAKRGEREKDRMGGGMGMGKGGRVETLR